VSAPPVSPWLTVKEAAPYSKRSANTIKNALREGSLIGSQTKPGGIWVIHVDNLDAWIKGEIADVRPPAVTRRRAS
jgi:helix-turn-helix protein